MRERPHICREELCGREHRGTGVNKKAWAQGRLLDSVTQQGSGGEDREEVETAGGDG